MNVYHVAAVWRFFDRFVRVTMWKPIRALIDCMTRLITKCASTLFGFTTCLVTAAKAAVTLGMVRRAVGNIDGTPGTITWTYIRNVFPTHDVPTHHIIAVG